ncbi:MAG TPA: hypothetical protein VHM91_00345 [Verrucomicrobiales bacterium]|jgi:hypothetical protein|nr:hypothetical protein [Verrucomicrobiales bacterium]
MNTPPSPFKTARYSAEASLRPGLALWLLFLTLFAPLRAAEFFTPPAGSCTLEEASGLIPNDAKALVLLDARLHALISPALHDYLGNAARRRQFRITVLPVGKLDDCPPATLRNVMKALHSAHPGVEGILFAGNVKLPSFFMPRPDIHSTRLWPRFYEDLDMEPSLGIPAGTVLTDRPQWPRVAGAKSLTVKEHDYDSFTEGKSAGATWWVAHLPAGYQDDSMNTYEGWAKQLTPFFKKAAAFHAGATEYGRGLYLVSNDCSLMERGKPVWETVGPGKIEFFALNEKGPGVFKNNPDGYQRVPLEKFAGLDAFLTHARSLPWMDEGWQSATVFLEHMAQTRRRIVWWNVHSNPELSLVSWKEAGKMSGGGLIAMLNGCSVGGFRQPGSASFVDTKTTPEQNVLTNLVYGSSAFVAALGSTHDRVTDEHGTPLLQHLYSGGYLGMAHLLRLRQADKEVHGNPMQLREFQEILIGDPFADAK